MLFLQCVAVLIFFFLLIFFSFLYLRTLHRAYYVIHGYLGWLIAKECSSWQDISRTEFFMLFFMLFVRGIFCYVRNDWATLMHWSSCWSLIWKFILHLWRCLGVVVGSFIFSLYLLILIPALSNAIWPQLIPSKRDNTVKMGFPQNYLGLCFRFSKIFREVFSLLM